MPAEIAVLGTGGTIASSAGEGGATPDLTAADLLEAVPAIEEYASLTVEQVAQVPSFTMDLETLAEVREAVRDAVGGGADGVVITHGTDTMDESAYFLDLTLDPDVPVVLTGAQRRPDQPSPDGPANLLSAVRAAGHDALRGEGGVYVAFDEELHAARDVLKVHSSKLGAFASPTSGPVGSFTPGGLTLHRDPGSRSRSIPAPDSAPDGVVPTVPTGVGVDGRQLERAVEAGADGVVLEASGLGNVTTPLGEAAADAVRRGIPVVVASRCVAGPTAPVYGTPGGGEALREAGVVFGGDLPAHKARIELLLVLEETGDPDEVRAYFEGRCSG